MLVMLTATDMIKLEIWMIKDLLGQSGLKQTNLVRFYQRWIGNVVILCLTFLPSQNWFIKSQDWILRREGIVLKYFIVNTFVR